MKPKKQSSSWYIAATHYLTSGFAIPLVVNILAQLIIAPFLIRTGSPVIVFLGLLAVSLVAIWFGVIYSANYLKKTYVIQNPVSVIKLSTAYLIVLLGIFFTFSIITQEITALSVTFLSVNFIAVVTTFYLASRRYVTGTTAEPYPSSQ
tara:strand:- start:869 stop:1315 length:447 start_codon:yes stop_codon:yes gene_type:complete